MDCFAFSPAGMLRTARMTFAASRRTKWRAASRPSPTLDPVTITVFPEKDFFGDSGVMKS